MPRGKRDGNEPVSSEKQKERDDKHAPVEEAKEEPAPQSELLDKLHAPLKRCLKQLKEGAEKAVGKPVPFAVETQLTDAVQSLRDVGRPTMECGVPASHLHYEVMF